jgi:hypothetical protein
VSILRPKMVFVPFEWDGKRWIKRDDLPRFKEDYDCAIYLRDHPEINFREGKPVPLSWIERNEGVLIDEFLRGIGTPEWKLLRH